MIGRIALGALVGAIAMWLLAGLWHKVIARELYEGSAHNHTSHEGIGIIFLGYLVLSLLMAYLYSLVYAGGPPMMSGLSFGALIGILWVFPHELTMVGAHGKSLSYVLKNSAWHVIEQGVGGVLIAQVMGASWL
jgi:hypothetical protein